MGTVLIAYAERAQSLRETALLEEMGYQVQHAQGVPGTADPRLRDAEAILVTVQEVTAGTLDAMPACKIVSRVGTGLDSIDLDAAARRGIYVTNVADYSVDEVSTHAIALLLAHTRRLPQYVAGVRAGQWSSTGNGAIRRLRGLTLGVVGFGRIGQATAAKGRGLGLWVLAFDPFRAGTDIRASGAEPVDLPELLDRSDFISLHVPLTAQTHHLINAQALAAMKPSAVLINTARGGLVDEPALAAAIRSGQIAGAALDVLAQEPPPQDHPLLADQRVLITPHAGWYSTEAQDDVAVRACEEVHRVLSGQPPRSPANSPAPPTAVPAQRKENVG
ncbi:MAG TPA: C-terminal binding protein [Streptosporangiaceae bacterium]|nr:C-terminal binding protein [Streptosporangiaceae bacterium]